MSNSGHDSPTVRPVGSMLVARARAAPGIARTAIATVLFADLRGYTGMAERLPAVQVVPLLDEFFGILSRATQQFGGEVYHMAGDGMMAGFGTGISGGATAALAAGHAMLQAFAPVAERWRKQLSIDAGIGIGVHLGEVAFGTQGPPRRKSTTLVGDTVNVAARLCSRARAGEVLFSCAVATALGIAVAPQAGAGATPGGAATGNGVGTGGGVGAADGAGSGASKSPYLRLPQFELRGRRGPIDIWCVPAAERLAL